MPSVFKDETLKTTLQLLAKEVWDRVLHPPEPGGGGGLGERETKKSPFLW